MPKHRATDEQIDLSPESWTLTAATIQASPARGSRAGWTRWCAFMARFRRIPAGLRIHWGVHHLGCSIAKDHWTSTTVAYLSDL